MKFKSYFLFILILTIPNVWSQTSSQARRLLESASKQMETYENIEFEFSYVLNNRTEQVNQESSGKVIIAKEKYKLNFLDAIQIFNGKQLYTIVPENEEITIIQLDEQEDLIFNPKEFLQFYKEGYNYLWDISQKVKGKNIQFVKLIPTNDNKDLQFLLVGIDTKLNHIYKLIEVGNNGTRTTLTINKMKVNNSLPQDLFVFDQDNYPNYYIND